MYRKFIKGSDNHDNQQNEQLSHNRIVVEGGSAALVLVVFLCILATASIVLMAIIHLDLLEALVVASFIGFFVCGWVVLCALTIRHVSATRTADVFVRIGRTQGLFEQHLMYSSSSCIPFAQSYRAHQMRRPT